MTFNMLDMGGIDLAEANGTIVEGIYNRILESANSCGEVIFYNWKFAGIVIPPYHLKIIVGDSIIINDAIVVSNDDKVTVPGINPEPIPTVLVPLSVSNNGEYDPADYEADGFSTVTVEVNPPDRDAIHIWTHSTGGNDASLYIQEGVLSGISFSPTSEVYDVLYRDVQNNVGRDFNIVNVKYSPWTITALDTVIYNWAKFLPGVIVTTWQYNTSINYILYKGD